MLKYENIKDALIVFPHNLNELKQSKLDMIEQISNTIDSHNAECDKIFNKFLVMTGGNSANKELLYNAVAAFLIQNSNQKNFKSLLISLISNNIKIKNNKINIVLPKMNEILKIISFIIIGGSKIGSWGYNIGSWGYNIDAWGCNISFWEYKIGCVSSSIGCCILYFSLKKINYQVFDNDIVELHPYKFEPLRYIVLLKAANPQAFCGGTGLSIIFATLLGMVP